jgi:chemotaxis response regulator CheB
VQDPDDAEAPIMPRAAIERAGADAVLPLAEIGPALVELAAGRRP